MGIGTSAGGLSALKRLFEFIPSDTGLAFVVVVHLSPEHKSHLADLLQPSVRFPVRQVTETVPLEANNVYVIPPNANLDTIDTHLRLSKLEEKRRERAPIDHFFRTLAKTHDGHSIGVILTGTGSDGTLGLKEIKAKGGLILVQDPNEAEFDGMPQSAIATGLVDRILPIAEIPEALQRLAKTGPRIALNGITDEAAPPERTLLPKVIAILKARTERDFSRYKSATLLRRIGRRMQLNYIEDFNRYLDRLREQPNEAAALADDLLITVTSFFRDPEVFNKLEREVVPQLFDGKGPDDTLRVWSVGCATGEEAYSLAILLLEEAARHDSPPRIQIFASDLHKRSLDGAREGLYPGDIDSDVSSERLNRFFQREHGGYRIAKEVRDTVVFAPHNLLGDPPFSRLHLITCRNLLIYLDRSVQRDVIDLFHYALCPDGYLLLGSAETIDASELFRTEDKKVCLHRKRNVPPPEPRLPVFPFTRFRIPDEPALKADTPAAVPYQSLHHNLLERFAPPSILVGPDNKLMHLSEHAGRYLNHPGGEVTSNVLKLVRDELQMQLQALLHSARDTKKFVDSRPIPVRFNGHSAPVVMHLRPAQESGEDGFVLVIFEEHQPEEQDNHPTGQTSPNAQEMGATSANVASAGHNAKRLIDLEAEVNAARQRLQSTIEEYETSREEMKASHEEMQSTNEELRSTMEELETSKEELQSINEELQTVNQENRHKVEELSQLTGDLQNLFAATDIATLFLDRELRILRFTPKLAQLFNVRITDRSRPISDLTHRLGYAQLQEDACGVLASLIPVEREIQDDAGRWYLTRVLPYRSTENRIEGLVITFIEITARKLAETALLESQQRQSFLLQLSDELRPLMDPEAVQVKAARLLGVRLGADRVFYAEVDRDQSATVAAGYHAAGVTPMVGLHRFDAFGAPAIETLKAGSTLIYDDVANLTALSSAERDAYAQLGIAAQVNAPLRKDDRLLAFLGVHQSTPRQWTGDDIALIEAVADRTWIAVERARIEKTLRQSEKRLQLALDASQMGTFLYHVAEDRGEPDARALSLFGLGETGTLNLNETLKNIILAEDQAAYSEALGQAIDPAGSGLLQTEIRVIHPDKSIHWVEIVAQTVFEGEPLRALQMWGMARDITERKRSEEAVRKSAVDFARLARNFEATLSTVTDSIFSFDRNGRILYANRKLTDLWGLRPGRETGNNLEQPNYPLELHGQLLEDVRRVFDEGETIQNEGSYTSPAGILGYYDYIMSPAFGLDGTVDHVVGSARDISERKRIEQAVRDSEEQYRTLFTSIDQGFCTIQVLFNQQGKAFDYRFLETNPSFLRQTGLENAAGKTMRELAPHHEQFWFDTYGRIATTGEALHFEHQAAALGFFYDVYAFAIGAPGENRVAILFNDITQRKRDGEVQAYLLKLSDALRPLKSPPEIQDEAARILGQHLRVNSAYFYQLFEVGDELPTGRGYTASDALPGPQPPRIFDHGEFSSADYHQGQKVVLCDVDADDRLGDSSRAAFKAAGIRAAVSVPLVKSERLMAALEVRQPTAREWTSQELAILEETAERTWAAVERARIEKALRESESRFRALATAGNHPIYRMSADWRQMVQLDGHHFLANTVAPIDDWLSNYIPAEDRPLVLAAIEKAIRTKSLFELEHRVKLADGTVGWVLSRAVPLFGPDREIVEWFGTGTDVTARKEAEVARQEAEDQFRLFVDNVQEYALLQTDPAGLVTSWNPGAQRLFGYDADEVVGRDFSTLMTSEDIAAGVFPKELSRVAGGQRNEDARWFVRHDGSRFWARWISEPMLDETGRFRGVAKIMRDETERQHNADLIQRSLAEKDELLKEVHHRVKNNLQVIVSLLNMQSANIEDPRFLAPFQEACNRVVVISSVHELLYQADSFANIVLADYARQLALRLLHFYGLESRVRLDISGGGTTLELQRAVPYGMLLNELISNACKHAFPAPNEGSIAISIQPDGKYVELTVSDTGPGLPDGFDYGKASSLGLRLVHGLVRQLHGTIAIHSKPGTTIKVRFPATGMASRP